MVSDDTEHAFLTGQALLCSGHDVDRFRVALARRLRWWAVSLPGGTGKATLQAAFRLWLGVPPDRSGVRSAGNGPVMRAPVIAARYSDDRERWEQFVEASTLLTHRDARARVGALAVGEAVAAGMSLESFALLDLDSLFSAWEKLADRLAGSARNEWLHALVSMRSGLERKESVEEFAAAIGCGGSVTGYMFHTVPVALFAWLCHQADARAAIEAVIDCGGDTDTVAALVGALCGATTGEQPPVAWLEGIRDWPLSVEVVDRLGCALSSPGDTELPAIRWAWWALPVRNLFFLIVILAHGFRRLGIRRPAGFRLSGVDALVLLATSVVSVQFWDSWQPWIPLLPIVVGHFFLFCNVFRVARKLELLWAGSFIVNVFAWLFASLTLPWIRILAVQLPITAAIILFQIWTRRKLQGEGSSRGRSHG